MADPKDDPGREEARRALSRLEKRVLDVQHLQAFEVSRREDGRFSCHLDKPATRLTAAEAQAAAEALEELAADLREVAGEPSG